MYLKAIFVLSVALVLAFYGCSFLDTGFIRQCTEIRRYFNKISRVIYTSSKFNFNFKFLDETQTGQDNNDYHDEKHFQAEDINAIIDAWNSVIKTPVNYLADKAKDSVNRPAGSTASEKLFKNIVIGINANIDLIVPATKLLAAMSVRPGAAKNHNSIKNIDQLQEVFHHYFHLGAAAERPFTDESLYKQITETKVIGTRTHIGGNAALMAWNIIKHYQDVKVTLVGPVGPKLLKLFALPIEVPEFSQFEEDEVHLIMEYERDEQWGTSRAPQANRFITSHDRSNANIIMMDLFFNIVEEKKVDLVILSGLHMLDSHPKHQWMSRINSLSARLDLVPRWKPVHLELASMTNSDLVLYMTQKIFSKVSSLGLNEQELLLIAQVAGGPHDTYSAPGGRLDIQKVGDTAHWLLVKFGYNATTNPRSKLTRVHFHTLMFHLTVLAPGGSWGNQIAATAAAARVAGLKACTIQKLDANLLDLKLPPLVSLHSGADPVRFEPTQPLLSWVSPSDDVTLIFTPVLVCKIPRKTVGLGDAISSSGLMYSTYMS